MHGPRTIARRLIGLLARAIPALVFGAAVSLSLAIWAANDRAVTTLWVRTPPTGAAPSQFQQFQVTGYRCITTVTARWIHPLDPTRLDNDPALDLLPDSDWRGFVRDIVIDTSDASAANFSGAGWPLNCLACHWVWVNKKGLDRGLYVWRPPGVSRSVLIPTRVLWRNLVANSAILGSPLLLVLIAVAPLRRWRRRRAGRCPACTYDLRHNLGAGCPECGWNRNSVQPTTCP